MDKDNVSKGRRKVNLMSQTSIEGGNKRPKLENKKLNVVSYSLEFSIRLVVYYLKFTN